MAEADDFVVAVSQLPDCSAAQILNRLNIPIASQRHLGAQPVNAISPVALRLIEQACEESANLRDRHVGTDHLLLALVQTRSSTDAKLNQLIAAQVRREIQLLRTLGFDPDAATPSTGIHAPAAVSSKNPDQFTVLNPALIGDPYPLYDRIRPIAPVYRDPLMPLWVVTGYPEAAAVFRDPRFRNEPRSNPSSSSAADAQLPPAGPVRRDLCVIADVLTKMLVFSEPPLHSAMRNQLGRMFSPRNVGALRDRVQAIADQLIDAIAPRGRMELIDDFAVPLPLLVVTPDVRPPP